MGRKLFVHGGLNNLGDEVGWLADENGTPIVCKHVTFEEKDGVAGFFHKCSIGKNGGTCFGHETVNADCPMHDIIFKFGNLNSQAALQSCKSFKFIDEGELKDEFEFVKIDEFNDSPGDAKDHCRILMNFGPEALEEKFGILLDIPIIRL